jgi:general secretion pathway protein A
MYYDYFGIREAPFSIAPNPDFLYMSERHREALAHLLYGIKSDGGFILLTGEVGTGKTTVCRCLLGQIPEDVNIAFVLNPKLTAVELLATACDDLGISYPVDASIKVMVDRLNEFLLASHKEGKKTVLIIDEAQNLSADVLEQLRLLTNLETNQRKLLQIILLGQPELVEMLDKKELRQLSQRVTARFHLDALKRNEVHEYIKYRLSIAGATGEIFPRSAVNRIFKVSGGIPRVINLICDRALLGAYAENKMLVSKLMINKAADEIRGQRHQHRPRWPYAIAAVLVLGVAITFILNSQSSAPNVAIEQSTLVNMRADDYGFNDGIPRTMRFDLNSITDIFGHNDVQRAFADLFVQWGISFEIKQPRPCTQALRVGLKCFSNLGSLYDLAKLNRPSVISINGQWLTLSSLSQGVATLIAGSDEFEVDAYELAKVWDGKYTLFWRMPPAYKNPTILGDDGAPVDWLTNQLAAIKSLPPVLETGNTFDKHLEDQLKDFQMSVGLTPTGIAGVQTWIHVNSFQAIGIPVLDQGGS